MPLLDDYDVSQKPKDRLQPYLDAVLALTRTEAVQEEQSHPAQAVFSIFYKQHPPPTTDLPAAESAVLLSPPPADSIHFPEIADSMVASAEATFRRAIEQLKAAGRRPQRKEKEGEKESIHQSVEDIDSLWPPLEYVEDGEEDW